MKKNHWNLCRKFQVREFSTNNSTADGWKKFMQVAYEKVLYDKIGIEKSELENWKKLELVEKLCSKVPAGKLA